MKFAHLQVTWLAVFGLSSTAQPGVIPAVRVAVAQEEQGSTDDSEGPDEVETAMGFAEFEARVQRILDAHPDSVERRSLGKSARGRHLWLLISPPYAEGESPEAVSPNMLWMTDLVGPMDPQPLLRLLERHLERQVAPQPASGELRAARLFFLPLPNPDRLPATGAEPAPEEQQPPLDLDFPSSWQPVQGAPPWPLARTESAALSAWLESQPSLFRIELVAGLWRSLPALDPAAFKSLSAAALAAREWSFGPRFLGGPGSFELDAIKRFDVPWVGRRTDPVLKLVDLDGHMEAVARLRLEGVSTSSLGPELVLVSTRLSNVGGSSTGWHAHPRRAGRVRLDVMGASLVQVLATAEGIELPVELRGEAAYLPPLSVEEECSLWIVLRTDGQAPLVLSVSNPRALGARTVLE